MDLKEKTNWLYLSENLNNSFYFTLSKLNFKSDIAIIVSEYKVFKVKISHLKEAHKNKKLIKM